MKPFKIQKILIPIDFSETSLLAIEHAAFAAELYKAELVLVHVVEKYWENFSIITPEIQVAVPDDFMNTIENKLEEVANGIRSKFGVKSECITASGNIFTEIMSISKEKEIDLIVMGTHGVSGFTEFFVGSNTYKVISQAKCPVLSVQVATNQHGYKDILLPIDNSIHSRQKVNHAIVLAKQFASKVHVLGLADTDAEDADIRILDMKLDQIMDYVKKCDILCDKKIIRGSNEAKVTLEYAKANSVDLIVIMTDQDESITGRLLGTYAQQIVNHSKIPVMSIQPVEGIVNAWVNPY